jgi:hypothetical protein
MLKRARGFVVRREIAFYRNLKNLRSISTDGDCARVRESYRANNEANKLMTFQITNHSATDEIAVRKNAIRSVSREGNLRTCLRVFCSS